MPKTLHLAPSFALAALLVGAPAFAGEAWDHRGMQSHHPGTDRVERPLAPGEKRIGRIEIGSATASATEVPETLHTTTQRQWIQRGSFAGGEPGPSKAGAPRVRAGRHDGTPGVSHSSPSR
jgi:hypothetical protein